MRNRKSKVVPAFVDLEPLKPFVEKDCEISKADLVSRIAGRVNYSFLNILKLLQFHSISKDSNDQLYLL